jgi:hypothetical protein
MHVIIAAVVGFGVGVFCPAVAREVKKAFTVEISKADAAVHAEVSKVIADAKAKL